MGKKSREKGKEGEREVARITREHGIEARRGCQFAGGPGSPDIITGIKGFHFEIKRVEKLNLPAAIRQSTEDAGVGETPVVVHRRSREPWYITLPYSSFLELYKKAHPECVTLEKILEQEKSW